MVVRNRKPELFPSSYSQFDSMFNSLEAGDIEEFSAVKYLITDLSRKGYDLKDYPGRLMEFEGYLVARARRGDETAANTLLDMARQLKQRMNGNYSGDIRRFRKAAVRSL